MIREILFVINNFFPFNKYNSISYILPKTIYIHYRIDFFKRKVRWKPIHCIPIKP